MKRKWLLPVLCLLGTSVTVAQSPASSNRPSDSTASVTINHAFRAGFKDFDQAFTAGFKDFDRAFARMDDAFREGFRDFDKAFRKGFMTDTQLLGSADGVGPLTDAERSYAVDLLQKTKADLLLTVKGLSAAQFAYKADAARWSIADCLEHIAVAETGIFQAEQGAMQAPADPTRRAEIKVTDQQVVSRLTNRSGKAQTPEVLKPTGHFPAPEAALQMFADQRDKTITYLSRTNDELRTHYWRHPVTGTIDAYQTLLLLAAHGERHRLQIEEVKAENGFPK